ncbi:hypothetical protein Q5O14_07390 [Eubacteriaceae bacterium ES2]|nr:hypothetical protein Q5O14_07390 [Eubacteriaceae bacterium ES2]
MITEIARMTAMQLLYFFGAIFSFGLLLGFLENLTNKNLLKTFGRNSLLITGMIGVPVHELSHAIIAKIFWHKIIEIKLFQKPDAQGVMGYVNHSYNSKNIYQLCGNFFIGIAPIFGGSFAIIAIIYLFYPEVVNSYFNNLQHLIAEPILNLSLITDVFNFQIEFLKTILNPEHLNKISFYIFIFLTLGISSHMSLSLADLKGAFHGFLIIVTILILLNILGLGQYLLNFEVIKYNLLIIHVLMLATLFALFSYLFSLIFRIFCR